jgi:3-oxoacyl-[acyl-carrier protein] reductase
MAEDYLSKFCLRRPDVKSERSLSMFKSLAGRTAVVTGASKGIGRGIARRLGAVGCSVLVVARNTAETENVVREIMQAGGKASAFRADVADESAMKLMARAAVERYGSLDILCANAGIFPAAKLDVMSGTEFDKVLATNLRGTFLCVSACLPALKRAKGRIVVTSSITGPITGYPGWSHYGASKAGQLGFIRTAAIELAPAGVTINAVMPGNIATEGLDGLGPDYIAKMESSIPMKRLGTVEDIANAVLFFASDEAGYITGQTLVIDGGQTLPESLMALEEMSK